MGITITGFPRKAGINILKTSVAQGKRTTDRCHSGIRQNLLGFGCCTQEKVQYVSRGFIKKTKHQSEDESWIVTYETADGRNMNHIKNS